MVDVHQLVAVRMYHGTVHVYVHIYHGTQDGADHDIKVSKHGNMYWCLACTFTTPVMSTVVRPRVRTSSENSDRICWSMQPPQGASVVVGDGVLAKVRAIPVNNGGVDERPGRKSKSARERGVGHRPSMSRRPCMEG